MHEATFSSRPSATVRFAEAGRAGIVRVWYGVTATARDSGFDVLQGWYRETTAGVGFPAIKGEVSSVRPGYRGYFGWIQWVTQRFDDGRDDYRIVDRFPALLDRDVPFVSWGYEPAFFDAPAFNSLPAVDFRATVFLCSLPIMSRQEAIVPMAGFRWGYRIDRGGGRPVPAPLARATPADWGRLRTEVGRRHRQWKFRAGYRAPASTA